MSEHRDEMRSPLNEEGLTSISVIFLAVLEEEAAYRKRQRIG